MRQRTDLAYWFPIIEKTGVLVPRTTIFKVDPSVHIIKAAYGEPCPEFDPLIKDIEDAADAFGYPVFLRSGQSSAKHYWKDTCFVQARDEIRSHVLEIMQFSEAADMLGLPTNTWVVREFLPLATDFHAFAGRMPINKERRYFFEGTAVVCRHPYWPSRAFEDQNPDCPDWQERLARLNHESPEEVAYLTEQTERVAKAFDGAWSLDWACTTDGRWYAIDMAEAKTSFHWDGCPMTEHFRGPQKSQRELAMEMLSGGGLT